MKSVIFLLFLLGLGLAQGQRRPILQPNCPRPESKDPQGSLASVHEASFRFAVEFFKTAIKNTNITDNVFLSPYSVYNALVLAYMGSRGNTRTQLEKVLGLQRLSKADVAVALEEDRKERGDQARQKNYILEVANRAYLDERLDINPCMLSLLKDTLLPSNFVESERLRQEINAYVEKKTRGRIRDLIPPGVLDQNSAFALVNAAYFKGKWANQFKVQHTKRELFYPTSDDTDVFFVDMMYQKGMFRYYSSDELQAYLLEMPYVGQDVSMYILLPPYVHGGLQEILNRLTPETLNSALGQMEPHNLQIFIPKFKMEKEYELAKILFDVGLTDMFDPFRANFSDFANHPGLSVGAAIHKSFIKVDEEGSEAAAATVLIGTRSGLVRRNEVFSANHPFIYLIYDHNARTILFMGILQTPPSSK